MDIRFFNRLKFIYTPLIILIVLYFSNRHRYSPDKLVEIDALFFAIGPLLGIVIFQVFFDWNQIKRRKYHLSKPLLHPVPTSINNYPTRLNFHNIRISLNERVMDVFDNMTFKFSANKITETVQVRKFFTTVNYSLKEVEYILYEFDEIDLITFSNMGGTCWLGTYSILLRNGKTIQLFRLNTKKFRGRPGEYGFESLNREFYFQMGLKILDILSSELKKRHSIINYKSRLKSAKATPVKLIINV